MESIGFAAGLLALIGPILNAIDEISQFRNGPEALKILITDLSDLNGIVHTLVEIAKASEDQDNGEGSLISIRKDIEKAQTTFEQKLSGKRQIHHLQSPYRRRTWITQYGTIRQLKRDVVYIRKRLNTTMLSLLATTCLKTMHQHHLLTPTQQLVGTSVGETISTQTESINVADPEAKEKFFDTVSRYAESITCLLESENSLQKLPNWTLEKSAKYFPEQYIIENSSYPRMMVFSMTQLYQTTRFRVDRYTLLFAKDVRHWRRVTVHASVPTCSELSKLSQVQAFACGRESVLPGATQPQLELLLQNSEMFASVTNVHIQLEMNSTNDIVFNPQNCRLIEDLDEAFATDTSSYLDEFESLHLPQFLESEIITLGRRHDILLVLAESQLCIEMKLPFTSSKADGDQSVQEFMTNLRLLIAAQACKGVARFKGFVLSDDRAHLCSYLVEAPIQGPVSTLIGRPNDGKRISWQRRERWIRQIVTIYAELHELGIVLGLIAERFHIWVDVDDNVVITNLNSSLKGIGNRKGYLPPEFRTVKSHMDADACPALTIQTDVFQLGLIVWRFAENANNQTNFCYHGDCKVRPTYRCTAEHANPVDLPLCSPRGKPEYVDAVIRSCRQQEPSKRASASALLALIPPEHASGERLFAIDDVVSRYGAAISFPGCNECGGPLKGTYYHCTVCDRGDFDICSRCRAEGIFCYDDTHSLTRRICKNGRMVNDTSVYVTQHDGEPDNRDSRTGGMA